VSRFDAVAFDLFGTLIDEWTVDQWRRCLDDMAEALEMPADDFGREWRATAGPRLTGGFGSILENLRVISPGASPEALDEAVARRQRVMESMVRPRADAEPTLRHLRERGLGTALVSMCSPEVPALWRALPAAGLIDVEVFSSEDGVRKPEPAIYALAAERLGVPPQRVLYVGDGSFSELTGAAAAGMTAVLIRAAHEAEQVIERAEEDAEWDQPPIDSLARVLDHL
jgi:putative hydrolase of the HAD superfamily